MRISYIMDTCKQQFHSTSFPGSSRILSRGRKVRERGWLSSGYLRKFNLYLRFYPGEVFFLFSMYPRGFLISSVPFSVQTFSGKVWCDAVTKVTRYDVTNSMK